MCVCVYLCIAGRTLNLWPALCSNAKKRCVLNVCVSSCSYKFSFLSVIFHHIYSNMCVLILLYILKPYIFLNPKPSYSYMSSYYSFSNTYTPICVSWYSDVFLQNVIHRDIKPENLLVDSKGEVKLSPSLPVDLDLSLSLYPHAKRLSVWGLKLLACAALRY